MSGSEALTGWLFTALFLVGALALGAVLELRRRRGPGPWHIADGIGGLLLWVWLSTALSLLGQRLATGGFFPDEAALAPSVAATAGAGLLVGLLVLRVAGAGPLGLRELAPRWCGLALLLLPVLLGLSSLWVLALQAAGVEPVAQQIAELFDGGVPLGVRLGLGLYAVLLAPLLEELLIRGLLLLPLARRLGGPAAVGITALVFGLLHLGDPQSVPPLVLLGAVLAWLRLRSGSLWPPVLLHIANNAVALGVILLTDLGP